MTKDDVLAIAQVETRVGGILNAALIAVAQQAPCAEPLNWLRCLRGISTPTAITIVAELE